MRRILLLIAAPFVFLSVTTAQVTQEQADEIVLQRISQNTQVYYQYILFAKESIQTKMSVTTAAGEEIELDYPCWVYYVSYYIDCSVDMDCVHIDLGRYLIINENNGNLLEVKPRSYTTPSDLSNWREKYKIEPKEFELGSLQKILDGYVVNAIAFDSKGNAWIGTQGKGLIRYNANEIIVYNSENSALPKDFIIWDIAVDKNDNVWIGANGGAWKYDGEKFTLYNSMSFS